MSWRKPQRKGRSSMDLSVLSSPRKKQRSGTRRITRLDCRAREACRPRLLLSTSATAANAAAMAVARVTCATLTGPPRSRSNHNHPRVPGPHRPTNTVTVGVIQTPGLKVRARILTLSATGAIAGTTSNVAGIVFTVNSTAGCSNASGIAANTLVDRRQHHRGRINGSVKRRCGQ